MRGRAARCAMADMWVARPRYASGWGVIAGRCCSAPWQARKQALKQARGGRERVRMMGCKAHKNSKDGYFGSAKVPPKCPQAIRIPRSIPVHTIWGVVGLQLEACAKPSRWDVWRSGSLSPCSGGWTCARGRAANPASTGSQAETPSMFAWYCGAAEGR